MDIDIKKLKSLLPETPGIMGRDEYINTAVVVPLVKINSEWHLLFEKRSDEINQGGEICFPGGKFDPGKDEDLVSTAVRETVEELGVEKDRIEIVGRLDTYIAALGATIEPVIALLDIGRIGCLNYNKKEVESIFTIPVDFFKENPYETYKAVLKVHPEIETPDGNTKVLFPSRELGLPEKYHKPWGGHMQNIYVYKTGYGSIWGITARLIKDLLEYIDNLW